MIPFLTIVIPVRNEARFIGDNLMQLIGQDYPVEHYEILVVDGMSDDSTRGIVTELAQQYPQIRLMDNPKRLSSAGRNVGFRNGRGDYFLVIDGHCFIPTDKLFQNVVECFEKSGADCLGRPQPLDPPGLKDFQKAVALARASWLGHGGDSHIFGEFEGFASTVSNGAAYARHVFEKVGYVDENLDAAEDVEFNYRVEQAGLKCYTSPSLTVRYYPRESLNELFRQMQRYGMGRYRFIRMHPEALTLNQLVPAGFVLCLICLLISLIVVFAFGIMPSLLFSALPYMIYLLLVTTTSVKIATKHGIRAAVLAPAILFVIHCGLGWGFLRELISEAVGKR